MEQRQKEAIDQDTELLLMSSTLHHLSPAASAAHLADQIMFAALPLIAVLFLNGTPELVGLLVATHAAAWLAISLPAGALVDRLDRRTLLVGSQLLSAAAFLGALLAVLSASTSGFLVAAFIGAIGIVLFVLTVTAVLPALVGRPGLAIANSRLELARGSAAIVGSLVVAALAKADSVAIACLLASMCAGIAAVCLRRLPSIALPSRTRSSFVAEIRAGAAFVLTQPLLRAIALCSLFWNFAFFALAAAFVPYALTVMGLSPTTTAIVQGAYGAGALLAALSGGRLVGKRPPNIVLLFGPGVSVVACALILAAPFVAGERLAVPGIETSAIAAMVGYLMIGFGPGLWAICQTTVRQLLTPAGLIGRVSATIQTANFGLRSVGALCGGSAAALWGPSAAIGLATAAFAASFLVSVVSPLRSLTLLPQTAE